MGLSIHYSGSINQYDQVDKLMEEVADICSSLDWKYKLYTGDENVGNMKGISFFAEGSEPVFLTFLANGKLCSPLNQMSEAMYKLNGIDASQLYVTSTKTQYAGSDAHIAIIKLLHYLKEKYFTNFDLRDEGLYWETGDEKKLLSQFDKYEKGLKTIVEAFSQTPYLPGEAMVSLTKRIEAILRNKLKGGA